MKRKMDGPSGKGGNTVDSCLPNYKLGKIVGTGSFSKVISAKHVLTGQEVAIKILKRQNFETKESEEKVTQEITIMKLLMHPHIVRFYEVIETPKYICIVMEYVKCGDLFDYVSGKGRLQEDEARKFFQQIISGVEHCHRNMVVHRDLKPENLLLDSKCNIKIADFGFSTFTENDRLLETKCGSLNYAAPEVFCEKSYAGPPVDVWSCGIILYALLCGTLPFDDENVSNLFKKMKGGMYNLRSHLSAGARDLIRGMLEVDPMKRMTIPEIWQQPWFQTHLPHYLAVPPPDSMQRAKKIDEDILQEVVKMGFDRNQPVESRHNGQTNDGTVAHYLLLDNRFRVSSGYTEAEFQESMEGNFTQMHRGEAATSATGHHLLGYVEHQGVGLRIQFPVERKWDLELQIMTKALKALQALEVGWEIIGCYNMKCRYSRFLGSHEGMVNSAVHGNNHFLDESAMVENDGLSRQTNVVEFVLQLHKIQDEKYVLHLRRLDGPQFLFLNLCAAFFAQMRSMCFICKDWTGLSFSS